MTPLSLGAVESGHNVANPVQVGGHDGVKAGQSGHTGRVVGEYEASQTVHVPPVVRVEHERRARIT